ncbi:MAG: hypothetical protein IKJ45_00520, partial [Kiritimatiellae bacterium]|nr:hypothetical protein [Kiritimatiellia bacterium]
VQLARCLLKGLSLQESTEIIQLTKYLSLFLTYLTRLKGVTPDFPLIFNEVTDLPPKISI